MAEKYEFSGRTMTVHEYRALDTRRPYAVVDIDGVPVWLTLDAHGLLSTSVRHPEGINAGADVLWDLRGSGLVDLVCRGTSAEADDTESWLGPVPVRLRPFTSRATTCP